jgi:hypothetical protein
LRCRIHAGKIGFAERSHYQMSAALDRLQHPESADGSWNAKIPRD